MGRTFVSVVRRQCGKAGSAGKLIEFPEALVDEGLGQEAADETHLSCCFPGRIASLGRWRIGGLDDGCGDHLGRIALRDDLAHQLLRVGAHRIIDGKRPVRPRDVLLEGSAGDARFDEHDADALCAHFMVEGPE